MKLEIGISFETEREVTQERTALAFGSGFVPVMATPYMIALMEEVAAGAVAPALEEGKTTVGTKVEVAHIAATPVGMKVRGKALLKEISGKRLIFDVEVWDEKEQVGVGTHERFIVDAERFIKNVEAKLEQ